MVESELEKGTTFTVLLPIRQQAPSSYPKSMASGLATEEEKSVVDSLSIIGTKVDAPQLLIIEDNPDVITYIKSLLDKDYVIMVANDGEKGIETALENIPDIIISDVLMPKKNGYEVCQTLKNDERTSHIPIVLLTAKATAEDRIEGLRGGADAYLTKPFHKEELMVRLENLVALRNALQAHYTKTDSLFQLKNKKDQPSAEDVFLRKLITVVQERLDDPSLGVVHLCRAANLSNMQVNRKLKALTNKTPSVFIRSIRLHKGRELLQTTELNVSEVAYEVGFSDPNYFSRAFSEEFGMPPSEVRS
jgi:CheY-like chemotaxis protein